MCRIPVTLGGGMTMVYGSRPSEGSLWKYFLCTQRPSPFFSAPRCSKFFVNPISEPQIYQLLPMRHNPGKTDRHKPAARQATSPQIIFQFEDSFTPLHMERDRNIENIEMIKG